MQLGGIKSKLMASGLVIMIKMLVGFGIILKDKGEFKLEWHNIINLICYA